MICRITDFKGIFCENNLSICSAFFFFFFFFFAYADFALLCKLFCLKLFGFVYAALNFVDIVVLDYFVLLRFILLKLFQYCSKSI